MSKSNIEKDKKKLIQKLHIYIKNNAKLNVKGVFRTHYNM